MSYEDADVLQKTIEQKIQNHSLEMELAAYQGDRRLFERHQFASRELEELLQMVKHTSGLYR